VRAGIHKPLCCNRPRRKKSNILNPPIKKFSGNLRWEPLADLGAEEGGKVSPSNFKGRQLKGLGKKKTSLSGMSVGLKILWQGHEAALKKNILSRGLVATAQGGGWKKHENPLADQTPKLLLPGRKKDYMDVKDQGRQSTHEEWRKQAVKSTLSINCLELQMEGDNERGRQLT